MTLLLLLLTLGADPSADQRPITVTSHRWAPFISPMGEPFRPQAVGEDMMAVWFVQADRDRDGRLTEAEMRADAARFFATLDDDRSGAIDPPEIARYEWEMAPDVQLGSRRRPDPGQPQPDARKVERAKGDGLQGAARYTLLNMPQPVAAADLDFNRSITRAEFATAAGTRFRLLDGPSIGALTLTGLRSLLAEKRSRKPGKSLRGKEPRDQRVANPFPTGGD